MQLRGGIMGTRLRIWRNEATMLEIIDEIRRIHKFESIYIFYIYIYREKCQIIRSINIYFIKIMRKNSKIFYGKFKAWKLVQAINLTR